MAIIREMSTMSETERMAVRNSNMEYINKEFWDKIYPIGSIYISAVNTSPAVSFGGTWVQIKDRFLLAAGDTYEANSTGGSATNTHNHFTAYGYDGKDFYAAISDNVPRSRVVIKTRNYWSGVGANTSTREDSTYDETIDTMPPYLAVYIWRRIA